MVKIRSRWKVIGWYTDPLTGKRVPKLTKTYEVSVPIPKTVSKKKKCRIILSINLELEGLTVKDLEDMGFRRTKLHEHDAVDLGGFLMYVFETPKSVDLSIVDALIDSDEALKAFEKLTKVLNYAIKKIYNNTERGD